LDYDRFVDWSARLAYELPFFEELFSRHGVQRVLDAACGTGHHAIALAERGYEVVGADLSKAMVERAKENAQVKVTFVEAGFGEFKRKVGGGFDALICLGNSLPHILTPEGLVEALSDMRQVVEKGVLVIQNRNYDRVWNRKERFMPLVAHREGEKEWLFFRLIDFHEERMTFNMVIFRKEGGEWSYALESTELRPIFSEELGDLLRQVGFREVEFYGDYRFSPYKREESDDLIAIAR
ncbi:MAG: class I SAM-dependent methyltransferase, partial [Anaerolineae bacterium]